eukprot:CAMPEP_0197829854 /NCGR_PEP_ID=MMETSP1437-20131217/6397_1 /TAXON_ID=49252 ORGANISM="Eucampia antarctica, Strain CCMP1452" /NCGR_SAMPLE_ID=MMETSP1437 /ASSEMBLY_ACC=CAM_ASM_001096 /LENGTH=1131 /DNA_ID=CAMNT_0043431849 /DNA_START=35 /DNA_END=3430 /DNA_ORIENTATION=+
MVRKKLDERIRTLLERGVVTGQRSMLVIVGDHGKDQIPNLHQLLTKTSVRARPNVLWCYKKELGFSSHRKKRIKKIKNDKARGLAKGNLADDPTADNFELFISSTDINWCYYRDSHRVLGSTVGVLVLQDFEALTPNLMARTVETVEGGGLIIFLMRTVRSLKQLYTMSMDVHSRYRTETSGDVVPRFNERFILTLGKCSNCLVCDDELNVLPISKMALRTLGDQPKIEKEDTGEVLTRKSREDIELEGLKESLIDTPHVGAIVNLAKTMDQAKAILTFLEACSEKTSRSTVALTAARGRGKSAAIGLCLAGAISFGYGTIIVTAPEPENLVAVFDFVIRGLKALKYQEHLDYTITYNGAQGREQTKCIISIDIHRDHRQSITYIRPDQPDKFASAEIVAIDEAAAIPLPTVRALMGDRLTFMSSTINGYEGTGRALSLKLLKELRDSKTKGKVMNAANAAASSVVGPTFDKQKHKVHEQRWAAQAEAVSTANSDSNSSGPLREIELTTPIRYASGDPIENWLNKLLCLDCGTSAAMKLRGGAPAPSECELYHIDRDALFSYHKLSESFLQKLMGLYTSAHYKNTPNDLQMLSDAPAHAVFVLLSPSAEKDSDSLPDILAVVQVALEGKISRKSVEAQLARGHRSAGDLIPWTVSQQFGDSNFAQLSGARIVRVAVHPTVQGMGYGSRAIELLYRYYNGEMMSLTSRNDSDDSDGESESNAEDSTSSDEEEDEDENQNVKKKGIRGEKLSPRKELPPLLLPLTEMKTPRLDWIGTSFGLTAELQRFWNRTGMRMLYLRQTKNELTGEHSAIFLRALPKRTGFDDAWLPAFAVDTKRRIISLLSGPLRELPLKLSSSLLTDLQHVDEKKYTQNKEVDAAIKKRSGSTSEKISADELSLFLTPHDLKRLELYGRNLCDHHLVSDLLSVVARLYFVGRLGTELKLSSLQGAILCGIGLQSKTVDGITSELHIPSNQILAMFNKGIRKLSIGLNNIIEENEKSLLLGGEARAKAEKQAAKLRDVSRQTLDEDAKEGAEAVMATLQQQASSSSLPAEIVKDNDIMQYAIKGSNKEWKDALIDQKMDSKGTIQIRSKNKGHIVKRKLNDEDIEKEVEMQSSSKKEKKHGQKKRRSKN